MRVIVARHAETRNNQENVLQGSGSDSTSPLTEIGQQQSELLCSHLSKEFDIESIITSPANRALNTIEPMKHCVNACFEDVDIREIDCGRWEGKKIASLESEFKLEWALWINEPSRFTFPGGESLQDVSNRTDRFLKRLLNTNRLGDLLLVSHSATISTLIANIMNVDLSEAWETGLGYHKNAQYSVFDFSESGKLIDHSLKVASHLESP